MIDELEIELQETTDELEVEDVNNISYNELTNKPKINNVELVGNKTSDDLGLVDEATLDDYYTKTQTDSAIANHHDSTKQNTLVSGTNIKTINNQSVLGSGNIDIQGGGSSDYSTLTNKPQINNVTLNGNKSLSDLGINIPTKTSDLTNDGDGTNPFLTQHQSLENYSTTTQMNTAISTATNDMATQTWVEGKGYLTEHQSLSAYRTSANQDIIDNTKENTSNKVTSLSSSSTDTQYPSAKCVYDNLDGMVKYTSQSLTDTQKQQLWSNANIIKTSMDSVCVANAQYFLGEQTSVSITMPTSASVGQEILVTFSSGSTACTLTCDLQGFSFVPKANKTSWIKFTCCDATNWLVETKEG